jgi:hypothetical protein
LRLFLLLFMTMLLILLWWLLLLLLLCCCCKVVVVVIVADIDIVIVLHLLDRIRLTLLYFLNKFPFHIFLTDINECQYPYSHKCEQICLNNNGGYTCKCRQGYTPAQDGYGCDGRQSI